MPITSEWYDTEKTIMIIKYDGTWTLDDYYQNFKIAVEEIQRVEHHVITLIDFSSSGPIPTAFLTVGNHSERARAKNNVQIIVFGINHYMEVLAKMFQRIFPRVTRGMKVVSNMDDALEAAHSTLMELAQS